MAVFGRKTGGAIGEKPASGWLIALVGLLYYLL